MQPSPEPGPPRHPSNLAALMLLVALVAVALIAIAVVEGSRSSADNPANGMPQNIRTGP